MKTIFMNKENSKANETHKFVLNLRLYWVNHKKHEALPDNPPFDIYTNRSNDRKVFKIKDGYKLEFQTQVTLKVLGSTRN